MINRLPSWVLFGGAALTFNAGMINAVGLLSFTHQGVTHLTGTTTLFGIAVGLGSRNEAWHYLALIAAFVAGATLSGVLIRDSTLRLGRRYGAALLTESALLVLAVHFLQAGNAAGDYLASAACGLQNAMASTYSGAVVRTTHVSGIFTDLGIFLGHLLRRMQVDWRRFRLWSAQLLAFAGGGAGGAIAFAHLNYATLYLPALLTAGAGAGYGLYQTYQHVTGGGKPRPPAPG
jgi:uncharacterized membrane protein YoaK (UPF0700 family)